MDEVRSAAEGLRATPLSSRRIQAENGTRSEIYLLGPMPLYVPAWAVAEVREY